MTGVFKPRMEIIRSAQQLLWPELKSTAELGFVLYGGTAIALRLGHRHSVDFDFFSDKPLDRDLIHAAFPFMARSTVLQDERNALSVLVPSGDTGRRQDSASLSHPKGSRKLGSGPAFPGEPAHVKVFGTIGFGRVGEPELTEDGVLQVASLADLMATKVKVVLQRAEAKDYQDIAAMVRAGVSLPTGLAAAREIFGTAFQPSESLKALVYFEDGDLRSLSKDEKNTLVKAVSEVRDLPAAAILSRQLATTPGLAG